MRPSKPTALSLLNGRQFYYESKWRYVVIGSFADSDQLVKRSDSIDVAFRASRSWLRNRQPVLPAMVSIFDATSGKPVYSAGTLPPIPMP